MQEKTSFSDIIIKFDSIHQCALRLTKPGSQYLLTSLKLEIIMSLLSLSVTAIYMLLTRVINIKSFNFDSETYNIWELIFGSILFSPLIETAVIMLIHASVRPWLGLTGFVLINTGLFAAMHIPFKGFPISSAVGFLFMSYQYVSFRDSLGNGKAFAGVTISHGVNNSIASLLLVIDSTIENLI